MTIEERHINIEKESDKEISDLKKENIVLKSEIESLKVKLQATVPRGFNE